MPAERRDEPPKGRVALADVLPAQHHRALTELVAPEAPAQPPVALDQVDGIPQALKVEGGRQARDTAADDRNALSFVPCHPLAAALHTVERLSIRRNLIV